MTKKKVIRIMFLFILSAISSIFFVCAKSEEQAITYEPECTTILLVGGTWNVAFKCENGECTAGRDSYLVTQDASDPTIVTAEIIDSDIPEDIGVIFEGELCGNVFTFSAINPGNDEAGTWTFSDSNNFTKSTTFDSGSYTCVGTGTKPPLPLPAPYMCPAP